MDAQSRRRGQDLYCFGEFTLDVPDRRLTRDVCPVHLAPKTYDVLVVLITRAGRLVTKHELLESIWPGVFVDEGILTVHVAALRKALGDNRRSPAYIETVSRSGYRFVAVVRQAAIAAAAIIEFSDDFENSMGSIGEKRQKAPVQVQNRCADPSTSDGFRALAPQWRAARPRS